MLDQTVDNSVGHIRIPISAASHALYFRLPAMTTGFRSVASSNFADFLLSIEAHIMPGICGILCVQNTWSSVRRFGFCLV
jgi:hypothetical protein